MICARLDHDRYVAVVRALAARLDEGGWDVLLSIQGKIDARLLERAR